MSIETPVNGIWDLNENNPPSGDPRKEGDDHLRMIKGALKDTFPNITEAVLTTAEELHILDGATISTAELNTLENITGNIQTQIDDPDIVRKSLANILTQLLTLKNDLQQALVIDTNTAGLNPYIRWKEAGSYNKGGFIQNANSVTPGYMNVSRVNSSGSSASALRAFDNGSIEIRNLINAAYVSADVDGDINLVPYSGRTAMYNGTEIAKVKTLFTSGITAGPTTPITFSSNTICDVITTGSIALTTGKTLFVDAWCLGYGMNDFHNSASYNPRIQILHNGVALATAYDFRAADMVYKPFQLSASSTTARTGTLVLRLLQSSGVQIGGVSGQISWRIQENAS